MAYTVKQLLESKQFPDMRLVTCKENLNQEIKGIRIIDIEDMERYLTGGELLLTNMKVYFGETDREFRKHLNELEKKQVSGFIILDYMALENAVITLQYSFMETYAKNEIEKKYQRDIEYSLLNGLLTGDELSKAAGMLKLKDTAQYCVVSFHTISSNSEDYYTKEELEEIGVIEGEIQRLLPDEHIYRNLNQIVCIHEIKPGETQAGFREEMEKLYQTVQKQIFHRNKTTDFQIGIGSIVNGYGDLKKSFKDSKKIIDYMDMLRYLYGDKNISVADFSKLGFFQIFEKIKNRDELMEYVPESLVKLYWYDKEHDGELIETLQAYLDCDKSANKAAEKLYVNYRTLSGRLKKIKDISGIDFKNSAEMLAVRNGIVLFKMAETL